VADKFGRFLYDRRQNFVGRFYWQTKLTNFIVRLTSALYFSCEDCSHGIFVLAVFFRFRFFFVSILVISYLSGFFLSQAFIFFVTSLFLVFFLRSITCSISHISAPFATVFVRSVYMLE